MATEANKKVVVFANVILTQASLIIIQRCSYCVDTFEYY